MTLGHPGEGRLRKDGQPDQSAPPAALRLRLPLRPPPFGLKVCYVYSNRYELHEETTDGVHRDEVAYLKSQPLARLATVDADGQPDVVPVGFEFDGTYLYVGDRAPERTRKFLNVKAGQAKVALVVDDLVSTDPWTPRFLRVYGTAELTERPWVRVPALTCGSPRRSRGAGTLDGLLHGDDAYQSGPAPDRAPS